MIFYCKFPAECNSERIFLNDNTFVEISSPPEYTAYFFEPPYIDFIPHTALITSVIIYSCNLLIDISSNSSSCTMHVTLLRVHFINLFAQFLLNFGYEMSIMYIVRRQYTSMQQHRISNRIHAHIQHKLTRTVASCVRSIAKYVICESRPFSVSHTHTNYRLNI